MRIYVNTHRDSLMALTYFPDILIPGKISIVDDILIVK